MIAGIINPAGKDSQFFRTPEDAFKKLLQVGVGFGSVLVWFSGNDIDRKEGIRFSVEYLSVPVDEIRYQRAVLAIADAGADEDLAERAQVQTINLGYRQKDAEAMAQRVDDLEGTIPLADFIREVLRGITGGRR